MYLQNILLFIVVLHSFKVFNYKGTINHLQLKHSSFSTIFVGKKMWWDDTSGTQNVYLFLSQKQLKGFDA